MNTEFRRLSAFVVLTAALVATAQSFAADQATASTAVTVYVSVHYGKNAAEKDINAMHAKMEKDGWRFADMETNTENGDTEGFWLTYTRP